MSTTTYWRVGETVLVSLPYGRDGRTVHLAKVARIQDPGPKLNYPERTIKVVFDDPLVYGGIGSAWVNPKVLALLGNEPAAPDREPIE